MHKCAVASHILASLAFLHFARRQKFLKLLISPPCIENQQIQNDMPKRLGLIAVLNAQTGGGEGGEMATADYQTARGEQFAPIEIPKV